MGKSILIIEDDDDIALMVKEYMCKEGYNVLIGNSAEEGINIFRENNIDLILLDVMLPEIDGYEALRIIRETSSVPVIMLTAKGQQIDKILGFKRGCDDYLVKPFDLVELSLRIIAVLNRTAVKSHKDDKRIEYHDLLINKEEYKILKNGEEIKLTKKEFDILALLMWNQGKVYTSEMIYSLVWNEQYIENDNSVITHIRNIREKIGDKVKQPLYIKTIWGVGYKVEKKN